MVVGENGTRALLPWRTTRGEERNRVLGYHSEENSGGQRRTKPKSTRELGKHNCIHEEAETKTYSQKQKASENKLQIKQKLTRSRNIQDGTKTLN